MWKIISISSIVLIAILINSYIFFGTSSNANSDELNMELNEVQTQAKNNVIPKVSNDISVPIRDGNLESLVEIVLTSDDVKDADTKLTIGSEVPYNAKYITEEEVKESIKRIMGPEFDLNAIQEDYAKHIVTLRNVEMKENITESNSKVKAVIAEYDEKIQGEKVEKEEEEKLEKEKAEEESFFNDPYGSINNTITDLTGSSK